MTEVSFVKWEVCNCQGERRNLIFFTLFFFFEGVFVAGLGELLAVDINTFINAKVFFLFAL